MISIVVQFLKVKITMFINGCFKTCRDDHSLWSVCKGPRLIAILERDANPVGRE